MKNTDANPLGFGVCFILFFYIYKNPLGFSTKKTVFDIQLQRVDMYIE